VAFSKEEIISAVGENAFEYLTAKMDKEPLMQRLGNGLYVWTNLSVAEKKFKETLDASMLDQPQKEKVLGLWRNAWDNSIAGLKRRGIDWQHLQYVPAIIVDSRVDLSGWDVFDKNKSINPTRIKAVIDGIGSRRAELEGKFVTLDYTAKKAYEGSLEVKQTKAPVRRLTIPRSRPDVPIKAAIAQDANDAYTAMVYHPKALLAYEKQAWAEASKIFDDYVTKLAEEVENVMQETNVQKRAWLLDKLETEVEALSEPVIKKFMMDVVSAAKKQGRVSLPEDWVDELRRVYFNDLNAGIEKLLEGRSAEQFITDTFESAMRNSLRANPGAFVVHKTTSLNCVAFSNLRAGFMYEQVNPNPDYGIAGAARAIGDMWQLNRMELQAFKNVRNSLSPEERKNFGLQITNVKGTQAGAVMIAWREILKDADIIPGEDGLEVGVDIATPANTLGLDKYFEYFGGLGNGLSFISYDKFRLGAAWAGVDIFWDEWRRLATEEELMRFGDMAAGIAEAKVEAANRADPSSEKKVVVFNATTPQAQRQQPVSPTGMAPTEGAVSIEQADRMLYRYLSTYFGNVVNSVRLQENMQGALIIGANTIIENGGSITALKQARNKAGGNVEFVVWAQNEADASRLRKIGLNEEITIQVGLKNALRSVKKLIAAKKVVLINSDIDLDNIKTEFLLPDATEFFNRNKDLLSVHVFTPRTTEPLKHINAVPLAFAKAMALIFDTGNTREQFAKMVQAFEEKGMISHEDAASLNQLTLQLSDIPLVTVSDEIVKLQVAFEDTASKI